MYIVEIANIDVDVTGHVGRGYWLCLDTLVAEGSTLEELLENATISTADQDGGSGPIVSLYDLSDNLIAYLTLLVEHEYIKQRVDAEIGG